MSTSFITPHKKRGSEKSKRDAINSKARLLPFVPGLVGAQIPEEEKNTVVK